MTAREQAIKSYEEFLDVRCDEIARTARCMADLVREGEPYDALGRATSRLVHSLLTVFSMTEEDFIEYLRMLRDEIQEEVKN